ADHAAQLVRERARPCLELRIGQDLVRPHRKTRRRRRERRGRNQDPDERRDPHGLFCTYSAGCNAVLALLLALAGFGAPTRRRRSESESAPPNAITTAPSQIRSTSGL